MNYIKHLTGFFDRIILERDLNPTHISLYIALFQFWNINRFQNPISITRDEVMRISKICSKATYHKCMKELTSKGYIQYDPSFNPYRGSLVTLFNFSDDLKPVQKRESKTEISTPKFEQVVNKQQTGSKTSTGTSTEQALVSSINNTNITNKSNIENVSNLGELPQILKLEEIISKNNFTAEKEEKKWREKKKSISDSSENSKTSQKVVHKEETQNSNLESKTTKPDSVIPNAIEERETRKPKPNLDEVQSYFLQQQFPAVEAQKFFNYFSSNGWLVGGKTPMVDWTAAAQNWMLNAKKFEPKSSTPKPNHLHTSNYKNYAEPL